ncbi:class I SAM-dependent methyltransferase [Rhodococcus oryzae]|uniref:Class I SAM-dependent methyltransferase n=1 Tax=Rhodococcus oryzae TaxID=2571143 RepID=A0ABY2RQX2_9NOCA|nr:class I SAM-dependent methyltransferase [Rhodococcus oryzae]TJZ79985.1 class I SAM-dependent methyltransferase [Rhodococcus oryzae]
MTQHFHQHGHGHDHHHGHGHGHHDEAGLADMLDLDAEVLGAYLDEVTAWAQRHAPDAPHTVVDLGAGTGTGSLALARRFGASQLIAVDRSAVMLDRVRASARAAGVADRLRVARADLDDGWPAVGPADVAWAASSLHEVADPDLVLRGVHEGLNPGGLLVVVEMDGLPRFLPDDIGVGRPGLESRCHELLAKANWNTYPDWRPHLERAGFDVLEQRSFTVDASTVDADPTPERAGRYAHTFLSRVRAALDGQLAADDLDTLDHLLAADHPASVLRRGDLTIRGSRTAWAARRP